MSYFKEVNMDYQKQQAINSIVDSSISSFAEGLLSRYSAELDDENGVINNKKNNCFIAELGEEFMFYSAFVRSFDSSFGNVLERMGNNIAKLSYDVKSKLNSFILPAQVSSIGNLVDMYTAHQTKPTVEDYASIFTPYPNIDLTSYKRIHNTDHYFIDKSKNEHYLIELKASGDLDNKKAKSEKQALLDEYFLLRNYLKDDPNAKIKIFFATAYNKYGEGNPWNQHMVRQFFADEELLIGKDYWNFVCADSEGFNIVFSQYRKSADAIKTVLRKIKEMYFNA